LQGPWLIVAGDLSKTRPARFTFDRPFSKSELDELAGAHARSGAPLRLQRSFNWPRTSELVRTSVKLTFEAMPRSASVVLNGHEIHSSKYDLQFEIAKHLQVTNRLELELPNSIVDSEEIGTCQLVITESLP